ncbi:Glucose/arabinose dehydrogenase, beta-propeller fold [Noviherbaspirillum humi]|uniref:Glucose/arabinose dehydrogenase, beta-propeller fold n=1 Tax=Noviherbaspirillum humi TaxID=1688639 RepID=A0A239LW55_9BURK|nr:PQQ-dependent sugar dehydrogenase [Noviherbaspirillum humi]SNT34500.1 Glucose/arabinose dehydrogenase, beta-propeller fold [Noviherbaspirillum humi]
MVSRLSAAAGLTLAGFALTAFAQQDPAPAAAPAAPPPAWKQGMSESQAQSPLHPFAPHMTGRAAAELPIDKLKVPAGFKVEVWAEGIPEARSLALGDKGTVFVSNRLQSSVYAVVDANGKREVKTLLKGLNSPNGIVFSKGSLYVAERNRIVRYDDIESKLDNPPQPAVVVDNLDPNKQPGHFWKYLAMGPDGKLYFNIGSPQNITMPTYMEAVIMRVDPKTGVLEKVADGVRNSVGMDFHPVTKQLWFTEHARDWISDDMPSDELNVVTKTGQHFGFPFCFQGDFPDPQYGKNRSCKEFTPPAMNLGAHVAPLGVRFYTGGMFPAAYKNTMLIAQHGSWNRSVKQGYDVVRVSTGKDGKLVKEPFLQGFLTDERADPPMWGRPVDILQMRDGSVLVSDDYNGILYRVSYKK